MTVGADHLTRTETGQSGKGVIPEDDFVMSIYDEHWGSGILDNAAEKIPFILKHLPGILRVVHGGIEGVGKTFDFIAGGHFDRLPLLFSGTE